MSDLEQVRREGADALAAVRAVLAEPWYNLSADVAAELGRLADRLQAALAVPDATGAVISAALVDLDQAMNALAEVNIDLLTRYLRKLS